MLLTPLTVTDLHEKKGNISALDRHYDRTLPIFTRSRIHTFRKPLIKIFINLYSTKTIFINVDIIAVFGVINAEDACKNAHPQRWFQNFPPVQN